MKMFRYSKGLYLFFNDKYTVLTTTKTTTIIIISKARQQGQKETKAGQVGPKCQKQGEN